MAPKLFISYRRDDSAGYSGRVHDRLQREFGGNLFFVYGRGLDPARRQFQQSAR